jgi:hypothetical protein
MSTMIGKVTGDLSASIMWEDSLIDKEARRILKKKDNGKHLPLDIVGHLEFFYNTLLMSHESVNPFKRPNIFEALQYQLFNPKIGGPPRTLLEVHRQLTSKFNAEERKLKPGFSTTLKLDLKLHSHSKTIQLHEQNQFVQS